MKKLTKRQITELGFKPGLLLGIGQIVNVQVLTWLGIGMTSWVFWINIILLIIAILFVIRRSHLLGEQKKLLPIMLINSIVVGLAILVYQTYMQIYINFIEPGWLEKVVQIRSANLVDKSELDNLRARIYRRFSIPYYFTIGFLISFGWNMLSSFIITLIGLKLGVGKRK